MTLAATPVRVSVVIAAHNAARFLDAALDSVFAQTYPVFETIVVDDGSTDGTNELLERWAGRVTVLRQQHQQGVAAARNAGIAASRGQLVAFLDADDLWVPDKLERQVPLFENAAVGLVHCGVQYLDISGRKLSVNLAGRTGRVLRDLARLDGVVQGGGSCVVVRAECFRRVGVFDPELAVSEDWDLWRRIACLYDMDMVREPLVGYRLHAGSLHQQIDLLDRDFVKAIGKMFDDPLANEVHRLRRRTYGTLYVMLSGSWLYAGNWRKSAVYAGRAVATWPPSAAYFARFPVRVASRWLSGVDRREPRVASERAFAD